MPELDEKLIEKGKIFVSNYFKKNKAIELFNDFIVRVKENNVQNDGTDPFLNLIDKYVIDNENAFFHKVLPVKTKLYRARVIERKDYTNGIGIRENNSMLEGYPESGSREAPLGIGNEGRNNIKGVSYFYASDKEETACTEVKPTVRQLISLAEFETIKPLKIIDLSEDKVIHNEDSELDLPTFFSHVMFMYTQPAPNVEDYKATQVLTDYLRKTGIDGICYKSFLDEGGKNYTIFNSNRSNIKFLGSKVLTLQCERKIFIDFNEKKVIKSKSLGDEDYNHVVVAKMYLDIQKTIKHK